MNIARNPIQLHEVTMPLADLMSRSGFSWADRCTMAAAIRESLRAFDSLERERFDREQAEACGQCEAPK